MAFNSQARRFNGSDHHIRRAEQHIAEQRLAVERLRAAGHDTRYAEHLLATMTNALSVYQDQIQASGRRGGPSTAGPDKEPRSTGGR